MFDNRPYVSLEDLDERSFAEDDPRGFLRRFPEGAIIDEVQRVPTLLSYLQGVVDREQKPGQFILTGSAQLHWQDGPRSFSSYFRRDNKGVEVDLIVETPQALIPIEIKSGETFNRDFLKTLQTYLSFAKPRAKNPGLIFGGTGNFVREDVHVVGWKEATTLI